MGHIIAKEELKALHESVEDGTEPKEKKEKTESHEQKRKLERDLLKILIENRRSKQIKERSAKIRAKNKWP